MEDEIRQGQQMGQCINKSLGNRLPEISIMAQNKMPEIDCGNERWSDLRVDKLNVMTQFVDSGDLLNGSRRNVNTVILGLFKED
jgi:hypothetical protein